MNRNELLQDLKERFKADILDWQERSSKRVYVEILPPALRAVARHLHVERGARFNIATGLDARAHFEILYHFTLEEMNLLISLRVKLPKDHPEIDSLAPQMEAANWVEREIQELLGIHFKGHPDPRRLLLPENWPQGVYPLRQDYKEWDPKAVRDRGV